jgi:hypothetical protein
VGRLRAAWRACQVQMHVMMMMSFICSFRNKNDNILAQNVLGLLTCIWTWHAPYVALEQADNRASCQGHFS